jgi:hypothetical protein
MYLYVFGKKEKKDEEDNFNDKYLFLVVFKTILLWMTIKIYMVK